MTLTASFDTPTVQITESTDIYAIPHSKRVGEVAAPIRRSCDFWVRTGRYTQRARFIHRAAGFLLLISPAYVLAVPNSDPVLELLAIMLFYPKLILWHDEVV